MTCTNSTTIYAEGEINKLLGYVKHIKSVGGNYGFSARVVGKPGVLPLIDAANRSLRPLNEFLQYVVVRG